MRFRRNVFNWMLLVFAQVSGNDDEICYIVLRELLQDD